MSFYMSVYNYELTLPYSNYDFNQNIDRLFFSFFISIYILYTYSVSLAVSTKESIRDDLFEFFTIATGIIGSILLIMSYLKLQ